VESSLLRYCVAFHTCSCLRLRWLKTHISYFDWLSACSTGPDGYITLSRQVDGHSYWNFWKIGSVCKLPN